MKKLFSLVLALCLALSCIAFTASAEQTELEDVTLKVWIGGSGKQKDSDTVWALFNEQLKDYLPNTTVEFTAITFDEYGEKWSKAMASGEVIDAAWFGWMLNINTEIAMGSVTPLDDLIAAYGQDIVATLGQAAMDVHVIEGKTYAIPCWQGLAGSDEIELALKGDAVDAMENGQLYIEELESVLQTVLKTESVTDRINMFYDKVEEFLVSAVATDTLGIGYNPRCSSSVVTLENGIGFGDCYTVKGDATFTVQSNVFSDSDAFNATILEMARKNDFFKRAISAPTS